MPIDEVKKVCVVGAGTMGSRISLQCAVHGYETTVYDVSEEVLQRAPARQKEIAERIVTMGVLSQGRLTQDWPESPLRQTRRRLPRRLTSSVNLSLK